MVNWMATNSSKLCHETHPVLVQLSYLFPGKVWTNWQPSYSQTNVCPQYSLEESLVSILHTPLHPM